MSKSGPD